MSGAFVQFYRNNLSAFCQLPDHFVYYFHTVTKPTYYIIKQTKKKLAHASSHGTGDVDAKYHHGALLALTTGGFCCRSRADHVGDVRLSWNFLGKDINNVPLVTEFTLPDLHETSPRPLVTLVTCTKSQFSQVGLLCTRDQKTFSIYANSIQVSLML